MRTIWTMLFHGFPNSWFPSIPMCFIISCIALHCAYHRNLSSSVKSFAYNWMTFKPTLIFINSMVSLFWVYFLLKFRVSHVVEIVKKVPVTSMKLHETRWEQGHSKLRSRTSMNCNNFWHYLGEGKGFKRMLSPTLKIASILFLQYH